MGKRLFIALLTVVLLLSMTPSALGAEGVAITEPEPAPTPRVIAIIPPPAETAVTPPVVASAPSVLVGGRGFTPSTRFPYSSMRSRILQYREVNSDVVGWLRVPGTNINEPIVQTTRENGNVFYNTRTWRGVNFPNNNWRNFVTTSTFLDVRNVTGDTWGSSSRNTVLYGHNWTNLTRPYDIGTDNHHTMFGQLPSYTNINFARANPHIYYSNFNNEGIWRVFAVATVEVDRRFNYNNPNPTPEDLDAIIREWRARSVFNFGVDVNSSDRILTLSTCTREFHPLGEHQRFVVVARLLRPGESENDTVSVTVNPNPLLPRGIR